MQLPSIRIDVVKETIHWSQSVAKEYGQYDALVTYNLAIAKRTRRNESKNQRPTFDNPSIFCVISYWDIIFLSFFCRKNDKKIRWTICFLWNKYCNNGFHKQFFKKQNV